MIDDGEAIHYSAVERGTPVYSADGTDVGTVEAILDNYREHIFDGIVIDTGKGRVFVDAPEVARITRSRVTLTIDAAEAAELPEYSGTVQARAGRTGRRWLRRFRR